MEGRRVSRKSQKYNPLFIVFMCMFAAVIVMLILSIVLSVRLSSANKKLKAASDQVTQLEQEVEQLQTDLAAAHDRASDEEPAASPAEDGEKPAQEPEQADDKPDVPAASSSWLDLSGHSEVQIKPTTLLDSYKTYYTTAGVNLRAGPATSYTKITTVDKGEKVQVAAREGNWSFVKFGNRFGWINSDYLSTSQPTQQSSSSASSTGTRRSEATASSLRRP
ncbi:MAG: SH3 domain-containing protein [Oscillospiraceae bacterium]|nr:SH3 domain-containing protein [Oscillospiraceae bacterium]